MAHGSAISLLGLMALVLLYSARHVKRRRELQQLAALHGCQPIRKGYNKLPFGLDRKWALITHKGNVLEDLLATRFREVGGYLYIDDELGGPPILCAEPEAMKAILSTNFKDWGMEDFRYRALGPWLGHGIFVSDHVGDHSLWATARGVLRPSFARDEMYDLKLVERRFQQLLQVIPADKDGWTSPDRDLLPIIRRMTLDIITEYFCGGCIEVQRRAFDVEKSLSATNPHGTGRSSTDEEDVRHLEGAFSEANTTAALRFRAGPLCWLFNSATFRAACTTFKRFGSERVDRAFAARKGASAGHGSGELDAAENAGRDEADFVRQIAARTEDRELLRDMLIQMLFAGIDTSTSLLSFVLVELARAPGAWDRLRGELASAGLLDSPLQDASHASLKSCRYLQHIITETLRLYPSIPANSRQACRDTVLPVGGGPDGRSPVLVEKGTVLRYSPYVMQRREDLYGPDANQWNPDRWIERRPGWDYIPFSRGPRICLGQKFALSEAAYVLARLAQTYDKIEIMVHEPRVTTAFSTALFPVKGVPVRFHLVKSPE